MATITISGVPSGQPYELQLFCHGPAEGRMMRAAVNGGTAEVRHLPCGSYRVIMKSSGSVAAGRLTIVD